MIRLAESITSDQRLWFHQSMDRITRLRPPTALRPFYTGDGFYYDQYNSSPLEDKFNTEVKTYVYILTLARDLKIFDTCSEDDWRSIGWNPKTAVLVRTYGNLYGLFGHDECDWFDDDDDAESNFNRVLIGVPKFRRAAMFAKTEAGWGNTVFQNKDKVCGLLKDNKYVKQFNEDFKNIPDSEINDIMICFADIMKKAERFSRSGFMRRLGGNIYPSFFEYVAYMDMNAAGFFASLGEEGVNELTLNDARALDRVAAAEFDYVPARIAMNEVNPNEKMKSASVEEKLAAFCSAYEKAGGTMRMI